MTRPWEMTTICPSDSIEVISSIEFVKRVRASFADSIPIVDGYVRLHDTPGIGVELKAKMFAEMRQHLQLE